jgi:hypothetical protein
MPNEQDYYRHQKNGLEQIKNEKRVPDFQAAWFRLGHGWGEHILRLLKLAALSGSSPNRTIRYSAHRHAFWPLEKKVR